MVEVGRLTIPVGADLGPITKDLNRLQELLGRTENNTKKVTRQMNAMTRSTQSLKNQVRQLSAAFAAFFGARAIITTLADFEKSMSQVAAVTRATGPELTAMRDKIKELGATTEFTASQVADGFAFLGLAGFNATQSIAAMPAVLDLATASSMDLGRAADISSNIMSAFGIQAEKASQVADVLAAVNARANTSVEQLGDGMKYAGPIAQALGISINDTAAAIGTLSDSGIQGSMAGTGLRRVLSSLTNATPAATKTLRAMGLTLDELNPKTNDLTAIVEKLGKAGLTADEAFKIFGDRGAPAILALIENNPKLNRLTTELKDVGGAANEMATIMRDNLWGDLKNLGSAIESIIIALGESGLTKALRTVVQGFTAVARFIAEQTDRIVAYTTAIAGLTSGWGLYVGAIALATHGTALLSGALVILKANLVRIGLGAVIVLAGELTYWFMQLTERSGGVGKAFVLLGEVASGVWDGIVTSASALPPAFQSYWNDIQASFAEMILSLKEMWNDFLKTFEQPALTVTIGGKTHEILGSLVDLSGWKADLNEAEDAISSFRDRSAELNAEAVNLSKDGLDQITKSLRLLSGVRESQGGRVRHRSTTTETTTATVSDRGAGLSDSEFRKLEKLKKAYDDIVRNSKAFIEAQEIERQAIGMTELEAEKLRTKFDLLNQARRAGIDLTPKQIEELNALGEAMAVAADKVKRLQEQYDFAKDTFKGFFTDLKSELQNGASIWEAFGTAAANALQKIADKVLDMALNGIFDMIFNSFSGSSGGGFLGKLFGFESGTSFAPGGWSVVGERGPELLKLPAGSQVQANHRVSAPGQASFGGSGGSGGAPRVAVDIFVKDDGKIGAIARQEAGSMVEVAIREYDSNQLPNSMERVRNHPRIRGR